jgi:hypothetical protein
MLFTDMAALHNSPLLEALAIKGLSDLDAEVANDAANFLGRHGSAGAEQALWNRYEGWSREWSGRAAELRFVEIGNNPHLWDANLGQSLARALASGMNWLSDETKLRCIQALGVGANIRGDIEQALQAWSRRPLEITYFGDVPPSFSLAQYTPLSLELLKKKLAQFPSGTKFVLSPSSSVPSPEERKIREEVLQVTAKNGITVMCAP